MRLRWLAVFGQSLAVVIVAMLLGYPMPPGPCLALIALSAWLNIFLTIRWPGSLRLSPRMAGLLLAYDTVQLAGLLYLTGGLQNPFSLLIIVPVVIAAGALPQAHTLALSLLTAFLTVLLARVH